MLQKREESRAGMFPHMQAREMVAQLKAQLEEKLPACNAFGVRYDCSVAACFGAASPAGDEEK